MKKFTRKAILLIGLTLAGNLSAAINVASGAKVTVNGTLTTDTVTAASGATLQGNGSVSADIIIASGAFISPGTSIGTLGGGPDLTVNGTYQCELDGASSDRITTTGVLDITNATIDFSTLTALSGTSYIIASCDTLTGTGFATISGLPANYQIAYGFNDGASTNNIALVMAPYAIWATARGLDLGTNSSFENDPNGDGLPNVFHYAFDSDPLGTGTSYGKIRHEVAEVGGQDYLVITIPVRKGATFGGTPLVSNSVDGLIYTVIGDSDLKDPWDLSVVEFSPALASGLPMLGNYDGVADADWEYRSFRLSNTVDSLSKAFIRAGADVSPQE